MKQLDLFYISQYEWYTTTADYFIAGYVYGGDLFADTFMLH